MIFRILLIISIVFSTGFASAAEFVKPLQSIFEDKGVVALADVEPFIKDRMFDYDLEDDIKIDFRGYDSGIVLKEKHDKYNISVLNFDLNKSSRRFEAKIAFESEGYRQIVDIKGRYNEMVSLPVISSRIPYNTIITDADVTYIDYKKHRLRHDTIESAGEIIGNVLKRSSRPMRPLRKRDIEKKQIITKNSTINIVYQTDFMTLKASGVALEDGAKGDVVRIKNGSSNKIVEAVIQDSNSAIVRAEKL